MGGRLGAFWCALYLGCFAFSFVLGHGRLLGTCSSCITNGDSGKEGKEVIQRKLWHGMDSMDGIDWTNWNGIGMEWRAFRFVTI